MKNSLSSHHHSVLLTSVLGFTAGALEKFWIMAKPNLEEQQDSQKKNGRCKDDNGPFADSIQKLYPGRHLWMRQTPLD
jgi:hypothetical protein